MAEPDDKTIETTALRQKALAAILVGTGIVAVVGVGLLTEDQTRTDIELRSRAFTASEYRQYKSELVSKMRKRETMTFDERDDWIAMLNKECAGATFNTGENTIDALNEKLNVGC